MEKKRLAPSEPDSSSMPPAKQLRPSEDVPQPSNRSNHASTHPAASTGPNSSAHRTDSNGDDAVVKFQRKQLAAKIKDQDRDVIWLREKVDELQKLVAVLDAAPRAALYHMGAVREDLTLTLARLGLSRELDPKDSPVAAVMLDAEVVTNDSLGEMPAAIKKLTAQIVLVMEAKDPERLSKDETQKLLDELQCRNRKVSDQLDRYSERDKQSLVSSTTLRDEYDDLRAVCSLQRRKIVALEHQMQEKQESLALQRQEDTRSGDESNAGIRSESNTKDSREPAGSSTADPNGDLVAIEEARVLAQKRLEELKQIQAQNKQHISEIETLRTDIARRDAHVVPIRTVLSTGLYQTMEATLQQLYLKERTWQMERDAQNEEREAERKDAQEQINELKAVAEKTSDDFKRQLEEMRRIADAAKVEKDKVVMTYEARKMEAGAAQAVTNAWEKRTSVSEAMRDKMEKANQSLSKEVESLRASLKEYENQAKEKASVRFGSLFLNSALRMEG